MALGVCKFNVNTDLREAALDAMQMAFSQEGVDQGIRPDILPIMRQTTEKMGLAVRDKLELFGWSSKS
jgi:fructose/tagatose bisphosphate aldolase